MSAVDQAAPELPNWEGFGLAIMEDWGAHCDTEASVRFDLAIKFGILRPIAGGFDPDTHIDDHGDAERGDPWFELNRRADLAAPSAPAEGEGLRGEVESLSNRAEVAEAERDALAVAVREIKEAWDWWREDSYDRSSSVVENVVSAAHAKLKGEV